MHLKEDNASGFHSYGVSTGVHRPVTGGNDAPLDVGLPQLRQSAQKAKNILMGNDGNSTIINNSNTTINQTNIYDNSVHHSGVADGLAWFGAHFKEIAIVAAASAAVMAIAKLIKGANKSIKFRYNKVVKALQKAQKDFTLEPDGLNMKAILPGIGSRLNDWLTRVFSGNWKAKKTSKGNIGLHPFCQNYIDEIEADFKTATAAFSKIKLGADELDSKEAGRNTDSSVGGAQHQKDNNVSTSAYSGKVYSSFHEALSEDFLNEGVSPDKMDESVLAAISAGVALTSLAVKAGSFVYQRFKNGKPEGEPKQVQVTKESTREICYAIINNYADKYVNMSQVFKELGITSQSLADIDKSSVDKLKTILEKYQKPEKNAYTKQYTRINEAYKKMLGHYYKIGDGIIDNFVKYTEAKDEKHANLLTASKEKLKNMWDSQKDFYDNNFSHVLIEIVSSEAYIQYLDFIINKVLPVFKSGLAGDADYILDVVPKQGEYYLIRQTGEQAVVGNGEKLKGKVAVAKVISFDDKSKKITFNIEGAVEDGAYTIDDLGIARIDKGKEASIDTTAYKEKGNIALEYGKWLSLDPVEMDWTPNKISHVFEITAGEGEGSLHTFIYSMVPYADEDGGYSDICVVTTTNKSIRDVTNTLLISYSGKLKDEDIDNIAKDLEAIDVSNRIDSALLNYYNDQFENVEEGEEAKTIENIEDIIKEYLDKSESVNVSATSQLYTKDVEVGGKKKKEYVYAIIQGSNESLKSHSGNILNEEGEDAETKGEDAETKDENSKKTINPDSKEADAKNVKMLLFGIIDADKSISDDIKENKFDGGSITISKACSIKDVDQYLKDNGFSSVGDGDDDKERLNELIKNKFGSIRKSSKGLDDIKNIGDALLEFEKNGSISTEEVDSKSSDFANGIIDEIGEFTEDKLEKQEFKDPNGNSIDDSFDAMLLTGNQQYKTYEAKFESGSFDVYVYPTLIETTKVEKNGFLKKKQKEINEKSRGLILYLNNNLYDVVKYDKDSIADSLKKLFTSLLDNTQEFKKSDIKLFVEDKKEEDENIDYLKTDGINNPVKKTLGEDVNAIFHAIKINDSGDKFIKTGETPDGVDVSGVPEAGNDYINIPLKNFEDKRFSNVSFAAEIKGDKIEIGLAIGDETTKDEIERDQWTPVGVGNLLLNWFKEFHEKHSENENKKVNRDGLPKGGWEEIMANDVDALFSSVKVDNGKFTIEKGNQEGISINQSQGGIEVSFSNIKDPKNNKEIDLKVAVQSVNGKFNMVVHHGEKNETREFKEWDPTEFYGTLKQSVDRIITTNPTDSSTGEQGQNQQGKNKTTSPETKQQLKSMSDSPDKFKQTDVDDSVKIDYRTEASISESSYQRIVNVTRKISGRRFKGWYVLSEAVYDDGSNYKSKLDSRRFAKSLMERSDFSKFAKSSRLAKFMPFESIQNYTLSSDKNYVPSMATPLYESIILVKFDKMDDVENMIMLGKHKV